MEGNAVFQFKISENKVYRISEFYLSLDTGGWWIPGEESLKVKKGSVKGISKDSLAAKRENS